MKITFLGTGTSTGVPQIGCRCDACRSIDPNDKRLRASAIVEVHGHNILIDSGPDLRTQLLKAGSPPLDALLITHAHFDHVGGIIDLRSYCYKHSFPIYCNQSAARNIRQCFPYCFAEDLYPGVPTFNIHIVEPYIDFFVDNIKIEPLQIMHAKLPILGFKIGRLAYITDCKEMPSQTIDAIQGIDTLVINALRIHPHHSHISLSEALQLISKIKPRQAFLTHISHDMGVTANISLPANVAFAHDFQQIEF